jgi:hypothetical protein
MSKDALFSKLKFGRTCFAILLLTLAVYCQGPDPGARLITAPKLQEGLCPSLKFFNTQILPAQSLTKNESDICKGLTTSCCSLDNFQTLQNWWQSPSLPNGLSRVQTRASKLSDIALFTSRLLENYQSLLSHALKISESQDATSQCQQASAAFTAHPFPQADMDGYLFTAQKCWSYLSSVNTSLICAACDPAAQPSLTFATKQISLNAKAFYDFKEMCLTMVNLNIYHVYPYLSLVESLGACNSSGQLNSTDSTHISHKNLLTDSEMEDAELIFARSISFGVENNINSEGDYLYASKLYHSTIDSISMTRDSDFSLTDTASLPKTTTDDGSKHSNRQLQFIAQISHSDNAKLSDYKNYFKAKSHGDMFRMERVHLIQRALNLQEIRDSAMEDRQYRNQLRMARRLKSDPRKLGMQDESLEGNKLNYSQENNDSLFIRRLAIRRLGSDDSKKSDSEDDDNTAKSDANKDSEDDDDEDEDDSDEDSDPDTKEIVKKLNQTMSYSYYQGEFGDNEKVWGKKGISVDDFKKKLKNIFLCFDAEGTKNKKDENKIILFTDSKKCAKFGNIKKKADEDAKKDEDKKKKDKKEKEDDKKKKKSKKGKDKDKKKKKEEKDEDKDEESEKLVDDSIEKYIDDSDLKFPEDHPKKELKKKQLKCYEKFDKWRLQKSDDASKKKYKDYASNKDNKNDCEDSWKDYVTKCKDAKDVDSCKKLKKDMDTLLRKDKKFKKHLINLLTKLEEGIKEKIWKKSNIEKDDDDEESRRLWGENTSGRRLKQEKDQEYQAYKNDKGRQLNLDNSALQNLNFAPSDSSMFIKPEDLPNLKKYIHNPDGPSGKERKLFETYYTDKGAFAEQEKAMTHYQKKDFYRKLEMMNQFKQDVDGQTTDGGDNASLSTENRVQGTVSSKADGSAAANSQTVNHEERVQGQSLSPDGLTETKYATADITQSTNANSTENLTAVDSLSQGTKQFSEKFTKLAYGEARRLDTAENLTVQSGASKILQVKNDAAGQNSNIKTLHVEKNAGSSLSEDGLTTTNYKTEDISSTHAATTVENLTSVQSVSSQAGQGTSSVSASAEPPMPVRRLNRKLSATENSDPKAQEIITLDTLKKESGIIFNYSETSQIGSQKESGDISGMTGFGIDPVKVKNLNALERLEAVLKGSQMGALIEDKLMGSGSGLAGFLVGALVLVVGVL